MKLTAQPFEADTTPREVEAPTASLRWLDPAIAALSLVAIAVHLVLRFAWAGASEQAWIVSAPLLVCLVVGGGPLVVRLLGKVARGDFGADLLAGLSIVTSIVLGEYLAGSLVVLMLSGGETLEGYAVRGASSVLEALARRMPSIAHRSLDGAVRDVPLAEVAAGDLLVVLPHEACPVDGTVVTGSGVMDESYLTGEPYMMNKVPGSAVLSGAVNGDRALTIRASRPAADSRYAKIMQVMRTSQQHRPQLRRLGDVLGGAYTPLAVAIAAVAWLASGDSGRFLAVLVVATPCPLLIAIPVAIIGSISLAARRGIIIKDPAVLESIDTCRTAIFDKTGTLTYGKPKLVDIVTAPNVESDKVLQLVASIERYSKHPLATAIVSAADTRGLVLGEATEVAETPGTGLLGRVEGRCVVVCGRGQLAPEIAAASPLPPSAGGLECVVTIDGQYAALLRFRDEPRAEGSSFISHLLPKHHFQRVMIVSGDREAEVRFLADKVGIREIYAGQTPEQKLELVRQETAKARTVFLGDGINDAPALTAATVGIAFGPNSDVTAEAAGAVVLDNSLEKVDELLHIGRRMRSIALQSAVGGMTLSLIGMGLASLGLLPAVAGAIAQEVIDVLAVANALRAATPPRTLTDYQA